MTTPVSKQIKIPVRLVPHPLYAQRKKNNFFRMLEKFAYKHREKLVFVHIVMFLFFLALTIIPVFLPAPQHGDTITNHFTEFSQFMIWGLWFPFVFLSVLATGRSWCGILCPMGAASEWVNRIGFKRHIPKWLKWEGTPIISFSVITILGQTTDVRDETSAMIEIFFGTLLLALLIGFFYGRGDRKRVWCRHVCPIGLLLGIFSRMGIVQFSPKHPRGDHDRYTEKGICPTMIAVSEKRESRHCVQCFRCVKPTSPGGLFIHLRKPGEEIEKIKQHNPGFSEILFIFLSTGLALGGFLWLILPQYQMFRDRLGQFFLERNWNWIGEVGSRLLMSVHPEHHQVYLWLDFVAIVGFMLLCMLSISLILLVCTYFCSKLSQRFNPQQTFRQTFIELGYQFAPIAMMSIIIGLGDKLFQTLIATHWSPVLISTIKGIALLISLLWSIYLGYRILQNQSISLIKQRIVALMPGAIGSLAVAIAWWPAVFGLH